MPQDLKTLLEGIRRLKAVDIKTGYFDAAATLANLTNANVAIMDKPGDVLIAANSDGNKLDQIIGQSTVDWSTLEGFENANIETISTGRISISLCRHDPFDNADDIIILAEYAAALISSATSNASHVNVAEGGKSNIDGIRTAMGILSYSEVSAMKKVLKELKPSEDNPNILEGIVVCSKVADAIGVTRSVLVNALHKLAGTGLVICRSLGMKGTFVKVLEPELAQEIAKQ